MRVTRGKYLAIEQLVSGICPASCGSSVGVFRSAGGIFPPIKFDVGGRGSETPASEKCDLAGEVVVMAVQMPSPVDGIRVKLQSNY